MSQGREEGAERSKKKGQRGTSCISNMWHMQTIIEAIRLWKTHGGLWQMRVGKTRSTNGTLCRRMSIESNEGK